MAEMENKALYIENVPVYFNKDDINKLFSRPGVPTPVTVVKGESTYKRQYTWAIVTYSSKKEAEKALDIMTSLQLKMGSRPLSLKFAFTKKERELMKSPRERKPDLEVASGFCSICGTPTVLWCQQCHVWFCGNTCFDEHRSRLVCVEKTAEKSKPDAPLGHLANQVDIGNVKVSPEDGLQVISTVHHGKKEEMTFSKAVHLLPTKGGRVPVVCTYPKNPSGFWIQLKHNLFTLSEVEKELNDYCQLQQPLQNWQVLSLCAAQYEGRWYRGHIISIEPGGMRVHFIDYGDDALRTNVMPLREDLKRFPPLAFKCQLEGVLPKSKNGWTCDESLAFEDLCRNEDMLGEFKKSHDGKTYAILYNRRGEKMSDLLIRKGKAKPTTEPLCARQLDRASDESLGVVLDPKQMQAKASIAGSDIGANSSVLEHVQSGESALAVVSRVYSPTSFTVVIITQMHSSESTDFLLTSQEIFDNECVKDDFKPGNGEIIAAWSPVYGWNRAEVKSMNENLYEVHYLDYGDDDTVEHVCQLPERFRGLPAMGARCTLEERLDLETIEGFYLTVTECREGEIKGICENMGKIHHVTLHPGNNKVGTTGVSPEKIGKPTSSKNSTVATENMDY